MPEFAHTHPGKVLRDGLRLIDAREAEDAAGLDALREAARIGIADFAAGRFRSFDRPSALRRYLGSLGDRASSGEAAAPRAK